MPDGFSVFDQLNALLEPPTGSRGLGGYDLISNEPFEFDTAKVLRDRKEKEARDEVVRSRASGMARQQSAVRARSFNPDAIPEMSESQLQQEAAAQFDSERRDDDVRRSPIGQQVILENRAETRMKPGMSEFDRLNALVDESAQIDREQAAGRQSAEMFEKSWGKEHGLGREFAAGTLGTGLSLGSMVSRPFSRETANTFQAMKQGIQQGAEKGRTDDRFPELTRALGGAIESLEKVGLVAAAGGNPYVMAATFGVDRANEALYEAEQAGVTGNARLGYAGAQGVLEAGVTAMFQKLGYGGLESRVAGEMVASKTLKEALKSYGKTTIQELGEEELNAVLQAVVSQVADVDPNAIKNLGETLSRTAIQTAFTTTAVSTPNVVQTAINRVPQTDEERVQAFATDPSRRTLRQLPPQLRVPPPEAGVELDANGQITLEGRQKYADWLKAQRQIAPEAPGATLVPGQPDVQPEPAAALEPQIETAGDETVTPTLRKEVIEDEAEEGKGREEGLLEPTVEQQSDAGAGVGSAPVSDPQMDLMRAIDPFADEPDANEDTMSPVVAGSQDATVSATASPSLESELRDRGVTDDQMSRMTPDEMMAILQQPKEMPTTNLADILKQAATDAWFAGDESGKKPLPKLSEDAVSVSNRPTEYSQSKIDELIYLAGKSSGVAGIEEAKGWVLRDEALSDATKQQFSESANAEIEHLRTGGKPGEYRTANGDSLRSSLADVMKQEQSATGLDKMRLQRERLQLVDALRRMNETTEQPASSLPTGRPAPQQPDTPSPLPPGAAGAAGQVSDFPRAGKVVSGMTVRKDVPNRSSIESSLNDFEELPGIREVPMSAFPGLTGKSYSVSENDRIKALAEKIQQTGEINPLIVVVDKDGPYILEGGHRADALFRNGVKSVPALVVIDRESVPESEILQAGAIPRDVAGVQAEPPASASTVETSPPSSASGVSSPSDVAPADGAKPKKTRAKKAAAAPTVEESQQAEQQRVEQQQATSSSVRNVRDVDARIRRDRQWVGLMEGRHEEVANDLTPEEAAEHLARLNAAPGDNAKARKVLEETVQKSSPTSTEPNTVEEAQKPVEKAESPQDFLVREAQRFSNYAQKYEGGTGLAVGSEGIEYRWREAAMYEMRDALRDGKTLDEAEAIAKQKAREHIEKHNARRPKDINWKRWDGSTDDTIESAKRRILALESAEPRSTAKEPSNAVPATEPVAIAQAAPAEAAGDTSTRPTQGVSATPGSTGGEQQAQDELAGLPEIVRVKVGEVDQTLSLTSATLESGAHNGKKLTGRQRLRLERLHEKSVEERARIIAEHAAQPTEETPAPEKSDPATPEAAALLAENDAALRETLEKIPFRLRQYGEEALSDWQDRYLNRGSWRQFDPTKIKGENPFVGWAFQGIVNQARSVKRSQMARQRAEAKVGVDAALKAVTNKMLEGGKSFETSMAGPFNPELLKLIGDWAVKAVKLKVLDFKTFVGRIADKLQNDAVMQANMPAIESVWREQMQSNPSLKWGDERDQAAPPVVPPTTTTPAAEAPQQEGVGLKNRLVDPQREARGAPPIVKPASRTGEAGQAEALAEAKTKIEGNPEYVRELVDSLIETPRGVNDTDVAAMVVGYRGVMNSYLDESKQLAEANAAGDDAKVSALEKSVNDKFAKLALIEQAAANAKRDWHQVGMAWQLELASDMTEAGITRRLVNSKGGAPPTEQEKAEIAKQAKEIAELQATNAKLATERDTAVQEAAATKAHNAEVEKVAKKPRQVSERRKQARVEFDKAWDGFAKEFFAVTPSFSSFTPEAFNKAVELAKASFELGAATAQDFIGNVTQKFGKPLTAEMDAEFRRAWEQAHTEDRKAVVDAATSKIDLENQRTVGDAVRKIHQYVIERDNLGKTKEDREKAIVGIHEILKDFVPDLTPEQTARIMSGRDEPTRKLTKEEVRSEQRQQQQIVEHIEAEKRNEQTAKMIETLPDTPEKRRLRRELAEEKQKAAKRRRELGIPEPPRSEQHTASIIDTAKRKAQSRIQDLTDAISTNTPIQRTKSVAGSDTELDALRAERDRQQKRYDAVFGNHELSNEQRLERLETSLTKEIERVKGELESDKLIPADKLKKPVVTSEVTAALREQLDALKAELDYQRKNSPEWQARSDAKYEASQARRAEYWAERLASNDFALPTRKSTRTMTEAMAQNEVAINKIKEAVKTKEQAEIRKRWHPVRRGIANVGIVKDIWKMFSVGYDVSTLGIQAGWGAFSHPVLTAKSLKSAFASHPLRDKSIYPTEADHVLTMDDINNSPNIDLLRKWKLEITDNTGSEEQYQGSDVAKKIPGLAGSARSGEGLLDAQSVAIAESLIQNMAQGGGWLGAPMNVSQISDADGRALMNLVNVTRGRGHITFKELKPVVGWLNEVLWSTRMLLSRSQIVLAQPFLHGSDMAGMRGVDQVSWRARRLIAKEYARVAASIGLTLSLAAAGLAALYGAPGPDKEWDIILDPRSSQRGIRWGKTWYDPFSKLGQVVTLIARLTTGETKRQSGKVIPLYGENKPSRGADVDSILGNFMSSKLSKPLGMIHQLATRENFDHTPLTLGSFLLNNLPPMSPGEAIKALEQEGVPQQAAGTIAALTGFGNTYDQSPASDFRAELGHLQTFKPTDLTPEQAKRKYHLSQWVSVLSAKIGKDYRELPADEQAKVDEQLRMVAPLGRELSPEHPLLTAPSAELKPFVEAFKRDTVLDASRPTSRESPKYESGPNKGKRRSTDDDQQIQAARQLLKEMVPSSRHRLRLFDTAYKAKNGSLYEKDNDGRESSTLKGSVEEGRNRLRRVR